MNVVIIPEDALHQDLIKNAVFETLIFEDMPENTEVCVSIVSTSEIHALNKKFRKIDRPTDTLSFPLYHNINAQTCAAEEGFEIGDVIICKEIAEAQAERFGHSVERELAFLAVHSTLHLLGYDHTEADKTDENTDNEMFKKQRDILNKMGISR